MITDDALPPDWANATLSDVTDVLDSQRVPLNAREREVRTAGKSIDEIFPYYGATGHVGWIDDYLFEGELILVGKDGTPFLGPNRDKAYLVTGRFWVNNHAHILRAPDGISGAFIHHQMNVLDYSAFVSGTTRLKLTKSELNRIPLRLAPANEQRRIAEKIDELFSQIEAGEQALARAQKLLERYRQSVLHAAVTGDLTRDWREQHKAELESGEALLKRILQARRDAWEQAELAKMHARGKPPRDDRWKQSFKEPDSPDLTDPPEIPTGWHLVSCDAMTCHITSGSRAWKPFYGKGNRTFIMARNVRPGRYDPSFQQVVDPPAKDPETERTRVQKGDLLVTIVGANTGDVCGFDLKIQDHYVCQSVALLRPWSETYGQYLALYLQAHDGGQRQYSRYIYGAGRPHLSFVQLRQTLVALPPEREAAEIVARAEEILSDVDAVVSDLLSQPTFVAALRKSVFGAAFSGKLVPQDPADEPAAVLLERVREARPAMAQAPGRKRPERRGRSSKARESELAPELPLG